MSLFGAFFLSRIAVEKSFFSSLKRRGEKGKKKKSLEGLKSEVLFVHLNCVV